MKTILQLVLVGVMLSMACALAQTNTNSVMSPDWEVPIIPVPIEPSSTSWGYWILSILLALGGMLRWFFGRSK